MKKRLWVISLVAALGVQGIGCGGDDDPAVISKAGFLARGNQICADTVAEQTAAFRRIGDEVAGKQLTSAEAREKEDEFVQEVVATVETMVGELEELGVPAGREEAVTRMLDEYERGAEEAEGNPRAFLSGKAFLQADKIAKSVGLKGCEGL